MTKCHKCKKMVENSLVNHLKICENERRGNFCLHCRSVYTNTIEFLKHKETKHAFKCDQCMLSFISEKLATSHIREVHAEDPSQPDILGPSCSFCDLMVENHEAEPHNHICSQSNCSKRFTTSSALIQHLKGVHNCSVIKVSGDNRYTEYF